MLCILSAVFQLRALLYVLCAFVILNKDYLHSRRVCHRRKKTVATTKGEFTKELRAETIVMNRLRQLRSPFCATRYTEMLSDAIFTGRSYSTDR